MNTELDKVKSTITISLGLKNRLRDVKGSSSYETIIAQLLRTRNERGHNGNYIEVQQFRRKEKVYSINDKKIVFSYNAFTHSQNFFFDIQITTIREAGNILLTIGLGNEELQAQYQRYFELLTIAIQNEIEPLFKHKGRFEDYGLWKKEFEELGLPKKSFENDVMEKLVDYKSGVHYK